ncbi:MAG: hypothetical protein JXR37_05670 [Kiritimatiellae bacterium]|nr:hypothetical protein [Kiritimatiellia bacterium]
MNMRIVCVVIILALCTVCTVAAAPVVAGLTGTPAHGQTVTITGSGFGAKATAGPLVWDDFESGATGALVYGHAPAVENMGGGWTWSDYHSSVERPRYDGSAAKPNSARHSRHSHYGQNYNISLELYHERPETGDEAYFTYYWRHAKTSTLWTRNCKPWIEYGTGDGMWPAAYIGFGNVDLGDGGLRNSVQDNGGTTDDTLWGGTGLAAIQAEWIRIEVYLKQSAPDTRNGAFQTWIHRPHAASPSIRLDLSDTAYCTRTSSRHWRQWHFGSYHTADDPASATGVICVDDLYFDTTRARVEIGDAATWAACTHREIQIATAWNSTQISARLNQGTFPDLSGKYLYVVDAAGAVNAAGYPLASAPDTTPPAAPGALIVRVATW